eukprot:1562867-Amphidinium_carterae.1
MVQHSHFAYKPTGTVYTYSQNLAELGPCIKFCEGREVDDNKTLRQRTTELYSLNGDCLSNRQFTRSCLNTIVIEWVAHFLLHNLRRNKGNGLKITVMSDIVLYKRMADQTNSVDEDPQCPPGTMTAAGYLSS